MRRVVVFNVRAFERKQLDADYGRDLPPGERAVVLCTEAEIHPAIVAIMPRGTVVTPLVRKEADSAYQVDVRGDLTIDAFIRIITSFMLGRYAEAYAHLAHYEPRQDIPKR
jgi:hypothetical protein